MSSLAFPSNRWLTSYSLASSVALASTLVASSASAAPGLRVQTTQRGDFVLVGNTFAHECAAGTPAPVVGVVGMCGGQTADTAPDVFWRSESPGAGQAEANVAVTAAQARSTAVLSIPAGARVTHAFAYWGATLAASGVDTTATLERPGAFSSALTATQTWMSSNESYAAVVDVTTLVQTNGSGAYRMSGVDVAGLVGVDRNTAFAGWWMVVLYEQASEPLRTLTISDGLDVVSNAAPQNLSLGGFLVPASGFTGRLGVATFEGDNTITGDQLLFNGVALADAQNPVTNFFNGTRSVLGAAITTPGDLPQLTGTPGSMSGLDLDIVDVTGRLAAGQTSASVSAQSTGDVYFLATFVTAITTFAPDYGTSTKTVADLNGGDVLPGDELLYTLTFANTGNDESTNTVVTDVLPAGLSFVPGSLAIVSGANAGAKSDDAGDDQGDYTPGSRTVTMRIGSGANSVVGGNIPAGGGSTISFRARVDTATGGVIANQGRVVGSGMLGGGTFSVLTDSDRTTAGSQTTDVLVEGCSVDRNCSAPTPRCDTSRTPNACVACLDNADCSALSPVCRAGACVCVATGAESCDGADNDCNGVIDDVLTLGDECATGLPGACAVGVRTCAVGGLACVPRVQPGARSETCNSVDDDCNGVIDDGFDVGMICSAGLGVCRTAGLIACTSEMTARCNAVAGAPTMELCGNELDEDCDGLFNNGCMPDAGALPDAAVLPDAGTLPSDAGSLDAAVMGDAGRDASTTDAGYVPPDAARGADSGATLGFTGGACGCRVVGTGDARWPSVALALVALAATRRRRALRK